MLVRPAPQARHTYRRYKLLLDRSDWSSVLRTQVLFYVRTPDCSEVGACLLYMKVNCQGGVGQFPRGSRRLNALETPIVSYSSRIEEKKLAI